MPRDDHNLNSIPALTPDREDIAQRQQGSRGAGGRHGGAPPARESNSSWFLIALCVLAVVGLGAWSYLMHEQLQSARVLLADTTERMIRMEKRLSITDESMSQSSDIFQIRLKAMDSEIRKLWDNVWKRAKKQLAEQGKQIKALQAQLDKQDAVQAQMAGAHKEMTAVHAQLQKSLSETRLAMEVVEDQVEGNAQTMAPLAGLDEQIALQQDAIREFELVLEAVQEANSDIDERVAGTEEWVDAFNGYRTQINRKLLDLQGAVDSLQGQ